MAHETLLNAWKQREHHHIGVHGRVRYHGTREVGLQYVVVVVGERHARVAEVRVVERLEGIKTIGILLGAPVASQQPSAEIDTHLGDDGMPHVVVGRRYLYARDEVLLAVGARLPYGQLAAGEDDGLGEILEHERQCRCRVGHGVCAMEYHEAVV